MKQFKNLEEYYLNALSENNCKHQSPLAIKNRLSSELESIKKHLSKSYTESESELNVRHKILYQQTASDNFIKLIDKNSFHQSDKNQYQEIFENFVNELLFYLISFYPTYIDKLKILPKFFVVKTYNNHQKQIADIFTNFKHHQLDEDLSIIISDYISLFKVEKGDSFNFGNIIYFMNLLDRLYNVAILKQNLADEICKTLIKLNFNHFSFTNYLFEKFVNEGKFSDFINLDLIKLKQKNIHYIERASCYSEWPSIEDILIYHLEKINKSTLETNKKTDLIEEHIEKIHLNISVAQLGCLIRFFHDDGVGNRIQIKSVLSLISKIVSTKKQAKISAHSLSKEYYSVDNSAAAAVLDMLERMVIRIKKLYFN